MAFFSLELADIPKPLETRIEKNDKIEWFSKYLFQAFKKFASELLFYSISLLNQPIYKFFLAIKTIDNWKDIVKFALFLSFHSLR